MVLDGSVVDRVLVDGSEVEELVMGSQLLLPKLAEKLPSHIVERQAIPERPVVLD